MGNSGNEKMHSNNGGHRRSVMRRGQYGKNIIRTIVRDGREFQLHATKGWRSYRVADAGVNKEGL